MHKQQTSITAKKSSIPGSLSLLRRCMFTVANRFLLITAGHSDS